MKLLKSTIWSFLSVLIRGISALSVNKIFAVQFGPSGIALLAHFQNLIALITTIPNDGINRGVMRFLSPQHMTDDDKKLYFSVGFYLNVSLFIVSIIFLAFNQNESLGEFKIDHQPYWWWLFSLSMLMLILDLFLLSVVMAFKNVFHYFLSELIASSIFLGLLWYLLTYQADNKFVALTYYLLGLSTAFFVLLSIIAFYKTYRPIISLRLPKKKHFKHINQFMVMALVTVISQKLIDFKIRDFSFDFFGQEETGIWQGVVKISDYYMMAFTSVMMIAYYPQVTSTIHHFKALRKTLFDGIKVFVPAVTLGCIVVYLFRNQLLSYLLHDDFLGGEKLVLLQVTGDLFRMLSFLLSLILLAQARLKVFIIAELLSAAIYVLLVMYLTPEYGLSGFPIAGLFRFAIYFTFLIIYYHKLILGNKVNLTS